LARQSKTSDLATAGQFRNQLPLPRRAHGNPLANLGRGPQASRTIPLRVQRTDLGTGGRGSFLALQARVDWQLHPPMMSQAPLLRSTLAGALPRLNYGGVWPILQTHPHRAGAIRTRT